MIASGTIYLHYILKLLNNRFWPLILSFFCKMKNDFYGICCLRGSIAIYQMEVIFRKLSPSLRTCPSKQH